MYFWSVSLVSVFVCPECWRFLCKFACLYCILLHVGAAHYTEPTSAFLCKPTKIHPAHRVIYGMLIWACIDGKTNAKNISVFRLPPFCLGIRFGARHNFWSRMPAWDNSVSRGGCMYFRILTILVGCKTYCAVFRNFLWGVYCASAPEIKSLWLWVCIISCGSNFSLCSIARVYWSVLQFAVKTLLLLA